MSDLLDPFILHNNFIRQMKVAIKETSEGDYGGITRSQDICTTWRVSVFHKCNGNLANKTNSVNLKKLKVHE